MAALGRSRRRDLVATFNDYDESEDEIRTKLNVASRVQNHIRCQKSWKSLNGLIDLANALQSGHTIPRMCSKSSSCASPMVSPLQNGGTEEAVLERSFSFGSTLKSERNTTRFSGFHDSPISACTPTPNHVPWHTDACSEPCATTTTLKDARRAQKDLRKSMKKMEKEQKKAEKAATVQRRHTFAAEVAAANARAAVNRSVSQTVASCTNRHQETIAGNSNRAVDLMKKLTVHKPISRLTRRKRVKKVETPNLDDFDSKSELRHYLNPLPIAHPGDSNMIAELPGPLPAYVPFQKALRESTATPAPLAPSGFRASLSPNLGQVPVTVRETPQHPEAIAQSSKQTPFKHMRCDSCHFGIKLDEVYFQCSVCEGGDRLLCSACDAAGWCCRHELTERIRKVLRSERSNNTTLPSVQPATRQQDMVQVSPSSADGNSIKASDASQSSDNGRVEHLISLMAKVQDDKTDQIRYAKELSDLESRRKENDLTCREKEIALREREAMLHEREVLARERDSLSNEKLKQEESRLRMEWASFVGAQFPNLKVVSESINDVSPMIRSNSQESSTSDIALDQVQTQDGLENLSTSSPTEPPITSTLMLEDTSKIRCHTTKRKADGAAEAPRSSRANSKQLKASPSRGKVHDDDKDDEAAGSGTPKKSLQGSISTSIPEKLFACPFHKHDSTRYSERNTAEKHYRGCSSGYWPDISRLKQHLYRVHWRGNTCQKCFVVFKTKEEFERHNASCTIQILQYSEEEPMQYSEKFTNEAYNEIKRKRPTHTQEQVWYIIFEILFPGAPQPISPYADNSEAVKPLMETPPISPALENWETFGEIFDARLERHQDVPSQAWLRLPGAREFLREQLMGAVADYARLMTPATSPIGQRSATLQSPQVRSSGVSTHQLATLRIPATTISPKSSAPTSATSTGSAASHWHLPSHRRSFSRPLQRLHSTPIPRDYNMVEPIAEPETYRASPDLMITIPQDCALDQLDRDCDSWREGDELGLAITTDTFEFDFKPGQPYPDIDHAKLPLPTSAGDESHVDKPSQDTVLSFQPVKIASLAETGNVPTHIKQHQSDSSTDSGYGSISSSRPHSSVRYVNHQANVLTPIGRQKKKARTTTVPCSTAMPPPITTADIGPDLDALGVSFSEFLGEDMDELGNVGGRSLTDHLFSSSDEEVSL